jgi:hypothetical protein
MDDFCFELPSSPTSSSATTFKYSTKARTTNVPTNQLSAATTTEHSWFHQIAHILRPGKRIIRVRVCEFGVDPAGFVFVAVTFYENHKKKKKKVSPVLLIALQTMWLNNDVVSDDDEENADVAALQQDVTQTVEVLLHQRPVSSIPALQVPLSALEIDITKLPFEFHVSVRWVIIQANLLLSAVV